MYKYISKRLLMLIPILLGVVFIVFFIMSFTPGNPGRIALGMNAPQEAVDKYNQEVGYDRPFLVKYADYVIHAVTGDFGKSYRSNKPVFSELLPRFPKTLLIVTLTICVIGLVGIPLGILSAIKQYSVADVSVTVFAMVLAAIPQFWFALLLILAFSLRLGLLPSFGSGSLAHYILPVLAMGLPGSAGVMRMTRSTMLESIREDYVRTARAKGVPENVVIWKHALKNALLPVITMMGMSFGLSLGGTVMIEQIFGIQGIGKLMILSIVAKDQPMVMACTVFLATLFCLIMLIVDLLYAFIDPRVKAQFVK
ncbi:MAG: ABC transporter permease [Clostridiales Family XIII bacterium]|jgi:peptide/nickel transport system permease protein|nr:ABC transporter permease [Clostridiales Family XIII bacterium]